MTRACPRRLRTFLVGVNSLIVVVFVLAAGCSTDKSVPEAEANGSGNSVYDRNCLVCHGAEGGGDGPAAFLLNPKPRNFRKGALRLVSTDNGVATEDDIVRTLDQGLPGTPMASWPQLSDDEKHGLARQVLAYRRDELVKKYVASGRSQIAAQEKAAKKTTPGKVIDARAPDKEYSKAELYASFQELCAPCHAEDGTGRDDPQWRTAEGFSIKSRNFKAGVFKGGRGDLDLYRRIASGMPGTPMPAFRSMPPEQIWKVVRYIQSLSDPQAQERAWVRYQLIQSAKVPTVPVNASVSLWNSAPATQIALMPLWANPNAVTSVTVRVLHDDSRIGILLEWTDPERDGDADDSNSFDDGAAIMFASADNPPPFPMGGPGETNEIWHWRATADVPPRLAASADVYYSDKHGWSDQQVGDDVFMTATWAKNPKGAAAPSGAAREYSAQRFGTLTARPADGETSRTDAKWSNGRWRVAFVRDRATKRKGDFELTAKEISIAFALWDGRLRDRDGKKSVTIWNRLSIDKQERK